MEKEGQLLEVLRDLIWLNGVIATELIQITENTSKSLRGEIPEACKVQHTKLREQALDIVAKNCPEKVGILREHIAGHK